MYLLKAFITKVYCTKNVCKIIYIPSTADVRFLLLKHPPASER